MCIRDRPNAFGGYDETAEMLADEIESWAKSGIVNIVGGCCGTTPAYVEDVRDALDRHVRRRP